MMNLVAIILRSIYLYNWLKSFVLVSEVFAKSKQNDPKVSRLFAKLDGNTAFALPIIPIERAGNLVAIVTKGKYIAEYGEAADESLLQLSVPFLPLSRYVYFNKKQYTNSSS